MRKEKVQIGIDEYERLLNCENLCHKQRFTIRKLENDHEKYVVQSNKMIKKLLPLLLKHYSIKDLMAVCYEVKR